MSNHLAGEIPSFSELLDAADSNASTDWEMGFISDMKDRYSQYGSDTYVSDKQLEQLERIAKWD